MVRIRLWSVQFNFLADLTKGFNRFMPFVTLESFKV